jgi:hypothetical protein
VRLKYVNVRTHAISSFVERMDYLCVRMLVSVLYHMCQINLHDANHDDPALGASGGGGGVQVVQAFEVRSIAVPDRDRHLGRVSILKA